MILGQGTLVVIDLETTGSDFRRSDESVISVGLVAARIENGSYRVLRAKQWNVQPLADVELAAFWKNHPQALQLALEDPRFSPNEMMLEFARLLAQIASDSKNGYVAAAWPAQFERDWLLKYEELTGVVLGVSSRLLCLRGLYDEHFSDDSMEEYPFALTHPHVGLLDAFEEALLGLYMAARIDGVPTPSPTEPVEFAHVGDRVLIDEMSQRLSKGKN